MGYPFVRARAGIARLVAWMIGVVWIVVTYGQSNSDNRSEGTGSSAADTRARRSRAWMMDNDAAPGKPLGDDFLGPEATALIPFRDGRGVTYHTVTIANGSPAVVTFVGGHSYATRTSIILSTTGSLPDGVPEGTTVYIVNPDTSAGTAQLSSTDPNDATTLIDASGTQSGVHTARRVTSVAPLGQSLGCFMWRADMIDAEAGRDLVTRSFLSGGEGGKSIYDLGPDSTAVWAGGRNYFDRWISMISRQVALWLSIWGRAAIVRVWIHSQFEEDAGNNADPQAWKAETENVFARGVLEIKAITGQSENPVIIFDIGVPVAASANSPPVPSLIPTMQHRIAVENKLGCVITVGPSYDLPRANSAGALHRTSEGQAVLAEKMAVAEGIYRAGGTPDWCYATAFDLVGAAILVTCNVPERPLRIDTTVLPAATGTNADGDVLVLGWHFEDAIGTYITDVRVSGEDKISISLSQVPSGTKTLTYAIRGFGNQTITDLITGRTNAKSPDAWGNIFDSRQDACLIVTNGVLRNPLTPLSHTF